MAYSLAMARAGPGPGIFQYSVGHSPYTRAAMISSEAQPGSPAGAPSRAAFLPPRPLWPWRDCRLQSCNASNCSRALVRCPEETYHVVSPGACPQRLAARAEAGAPAAASAH